MIFKPMDATQTKEYIVGQLNLASLLPDEQDSVIKKLENNISTKAFIAILDVLGEKERKELLALSEDGGATEVHNFIEEKISNVKEITEKAAKEIVEDFRKEVLT